MRRMISFLDETEGRELVLPVTPSSYTWAVGRRVETVQLDQLGEVNLPGGTAMGSCTLEALLPARLYSFCNPGAAADPERYLSQLEAWCTQGRVLRFLVSGTNLNVPVLLEQVTREERDGTNDVYAGLSLRQYQRPTAPVLPVQGSGEETDRPSDPGAALERTYTVVKPANKKSSPNLDLTKEKFTGDRQAKKAQQKGHRKTLA